MEENIFEDNGDEDEENGSEASDYDGEECNEGIQEDNQVDAETKGSKEDPSQYVRVEGSDNVGVIIEADIIASKDVPMDLNKNLEDML